MPEIDETGSVSHLKHFNSLIVTIFHGQNLQTNPTPEAVFCVVNLLTPDGSIAESLRTAEVRGPGADVTPVFDAKLILPYRAQRLLQFEVHGISSSGHEFNIGQYSLNLTPFTDVIKVLNAKITLKDASNAQAGRLNVKVKMSTQDAAQAKLTTQPSRSDPLSSRTQERISPDKVARSCVKSLHIFIYNITYFRKELAPTDPYVRLVVGDSVMSSRVCKPVNGISSFDTLLEVPYLGHRNVILGVWDKDHVDGDRHIGEVEVDLKTLFQSVDGSLYSDTTSFITGSSDRSDLNRSDLNRSDPSQHPIMMGALRYRLILTSHALLDSVGGEGVMRIGDDALEGWSAALSGPMSLSVPGANLSDDDSSDEYGRPDWDKQRDIQSKLPDQLWFGTHTLRCVVHGINDASAEVKRRGVELLVTVKSTLDMKAVGSDERSVFIDSLCEFKYSGQQYAIFELIDGDVTLGRYAFDMSRFFILKGNVLCTSFNLRSEEGHKRVGRVVVRLEKRTAPITRNSATRANEI